MSVRQLRFTNPDRLSEHTNPLVLECQLVDVWGNLYRVQRLGHRSADNGGEQQHREDRNEFVNVHKDFSQISVGAAYVLLGYSSRD
jgi:hypothetical protein